MDSLIAYVEFEEVLARSDRTPIPLGLNLLRCLRSGYRIALSAYSTPGHLVDHWLLENGFPKDAVNYRAYPVPEDEGQSETEVFLAHLDAVLFHAPVELVVTASPVRASVAMNMRSLAVLLFASPATMRPENRPGRRPWQEIEEEVSRRRILRTMATVGEDDDGT